MGTLNAKEKKVYEFIKRGIVNNGYAPSIRDIQDALGFKSTSTVHLYIKRLEDLGYITRESGKSRAIRIDDIEVSSKNKVPLLGAIRDGSPQTCDRNFDGYVDFAIPSERSQDELFAVKAPDNSLVSLGILENDILILSKKDAPKSGDIIAEVSTSELVVRIVSSSEFNIGGAYLGRVISCIRNY